MGASAEHLTILPNAVDILRLLHGCTKYKRCAGSSFLIDLATAMAKWLQEIEEEAKVCKDDLESARSQAFLRPPSPPEGKVVSAVLIREIRRYELEWRAAFDEGQDLDLIPVPCLMKDVLASITRQCPVQARPGAYRKRFNPEWPLENVGSGVLMLSGDSVCLAYCGITEGDIILSTFRRRSRSLLRPLKAAARQPNSASLIAAPSLLINKI